MTRILTHRDADDPTISGSPMTAEPLPSDELLSLIEHLERCTHVHVTRTDAAATQQWHERRNKARRTLYEVVSRLESSAPSQGGTTEPLSDKRRNEVLQGFIGFIGSGENSRGRFPKTLTELSDDARDYVNIGATPEPSPASPAPRTTYEMFTREQVEQANANDEQRLDWIEIHGLPDPKVYDGYTLREAVDAASRASSGASA
jgi:hypothetical protein